MDEALFTRYHLTITTLSPLHIGSGGRLREGYDFFSSGGRIWVANFDRLFRQIFPAVRQAETDDLKAASRIAATRLGEMQRAGWLLPQDFQPGSNVFRYSLPGSTSTENKEGELHEFIKDVAGSPYLPGSSLKGAFRSALLRHLAGRDKLTFPEINFPRSENFNRRNAAKSAAQNIERAYFVDDSIESGKSPNFDLWRSFRISDTKAVAVDRLALAHVFSFPMSAKAGQKLGSLSLDFEALPQDVQLEAQLSIDDWLIRDSRSQKLHFTPEDQAAFSTRLAELANGQAKVRLTEEASFFNHLKTAVGRLLPFEVDTTLQWLNETWQLLTRLGKDELLLPVGRATGWRSKTLGYILQDPQKVPPETFQKMVETFDLGKGKWLHTRQIPITRMVATCGGQVRAPMGWVKIKMEPAP